MDSALNDFPHAHSAHQSNGIFDSGNSYFGKSQGGPPPTNQQNMKPSMPKRSGTKRFYTADPSNYKSNGFLIAKSWAT